MLGAAGLEAYPYVLALTVCVGVAVFLQAAVSARIFGLRLLLLILGLTLAGHVGGRLYPMWITSDWSWSALLELNYRHPGALAAVLLSFPLLARVLLPSVPLGLLADGIAPALAFSMATFRLGCLLGGCCFGTRCELPWAVSFPGGSPASMWHHAKGWIESDTHPSLPVHPLQFYFILLGVAVGFFLLRMRRRKSFDGQLLLYFLALHETGKFALEFLRGETRPSYNPVFSLVVGLSAAAVLAIQSNRKRSRPASAADSA